jgi:hypothetical protein
MASKPPPFNRPLTWREHLAGLWYLFALLVALLALVKACVGG